MGLGLLSDAALPSATFQAALTRLALAANAAQRSVGAAAGNTIPRFVDPLRAIRWAGADGSAFNAVSM